MARVSTTDVLLYVPNLIGYLRIVGMVASFFFALNRPMYFLVLYGVSFMLDAADGYAARLLGQSSKFGAVLDMATDRVATNALVIVLSHLYPSHLVWFLLLCSLDLGSHWLRMYASLLLGGNSHKDTSVERDGQIVTLYYTNRLVLGSVCMFNEAFFVALYCVSFYPSYQPMYLAVYACAPFFALKQYISVVQLFNSALVIAESDSK